MLNKSRGRPRGRPDTRGALLAAARPLFLDRGYRGTTVRAVASVAGVDQALIAYHFGSKRGLFAAALRLPCADLAALDHALHGSPAGLADRLLDTVCRQWDTAEPAESQLLVRDESTLRAVRDYLDGELRSRIAEFLGGPQAALRATAAVGVLGGLVHVRYLSPLDSVARLTAEEVRRVFGPPLRAALHPPRPGPRHCAA